MRVHVYTLTKTLYDGEAKAVIAKTPAGEISVYDDHIPLISKITGAPLVIRDSDGKETVVQLSSGFIEVQPGRKVTVLADATQS